MGPVNQLLSFVSAMPMAVLGPAIFLLIGVVVTALALTWPAIAKRYGVRVAPNLVEEMRNGYKKGSAFYLSTPQQPTLVVPRDAIDDYKNLPKAVMSFGGEIQDRFQGAYTYLGNTPLASIVSIKSNMTHEMANIMDYLDEEIKPTLDTEMAVGTDWTPVRFKACAARIIAKVSGRVFVGPVLSRNEDYLASTIGYTADVFVSASKLHLYPSWVRPIARWLIPEARAVMGHLQNFKRVLGPTVKERAAGAKSNDLTQWIMENSGRSDIHFVAKSQLTLTMAATHTTANTLTHILYDLAARPEYIEPLRKEAVEVLNQDGDKISKKNVTKLRKLDSFMKESQRHNPASLMALTRKAHQSVTLKGGISIPKGSYVGAPSSAVGMDPAVWDSPTDFDGFRFERYRSQPGCENKYQFASTDLDAFYFGHGNWACPGRFFAGNEMKAILCRILADYEFRCEGEPFRPKNLQLGIQTSPPGDHVLLFRKRNRVDEKGGSIQ